MFFQLSRVFSVKSCVLSMCSEKGLSFTHECCHNHHQFRISVSNNLCSLILPTFYESYRPISQWKQTLPLPHQLDPLEVAALITQENGHLNWYICAQFSLIIIQEGCQAMNLSFLLRKPTTILAMKTHQRKTTLTKTIMAISIFNNL